MDIQLSGEFLDFQPYLGYFLGFLGRRQSRHDLQFSSCEIERCDPLQYLALEPVFTGNFLFYRQLFGVEDQPMRVPPGGYGPPGALRFVVVVGAGDAFERVEVVQIFAVGVPLSFVVIEGPSDFPGAGDGVGHACLLSPSGPGVGVHLCVFQGFFLGSGDGGLVLKLSECVGDGVGMRLGGADPKNQGEYQGACLWRHGWTSCQE